MVHLMANGAPVARLIGFDANELRMDTLSSPLGVAGRHTQIPWGPSMGEVFAILQDAAMEWPLASTIAPDKSFATIELKINFFHRACARFACELRADWCSVATRLAT